MLSEEVFAKCWAKLERRWGVQPKGKMWDYYQLVRGLSDPQIIAATEEIYCKSDYFPKPEALRQFAPRDVEQNRIEPGPDPGLVVRTCGCGIVFQCMPDVQKCWACYLRDEGIDLDGDRLGLKRAL